MKEKTMKKKYTKKQIEESIKHWQKILESLDKNDSSIDEAVHDGIHLSNHPTRRIASEKPTIYFLAVDMSDDITNYGQYIRKDGSLTNDMSDNSFRQCAVTQVPSSLHAMIDKAIAKYGNKYHIFVYHQPYSYGNQTLKNHARPSVIDIWYPGEQYWRFDLKNVPKA